MYESVLLYFSMMIPSVWYIVINVINGFQYVSINWILKEKLKVKSLSHVWLFATPWTIAYQAPLSMGFFRQEY